MQYLWRPMSQHFGSDKEIMTYAMYSHYSAPSGFDVDQNGNSSPITEDNKAGKMQSFKDFVVEMSSHYQGNHILIPMGDDFRYEDASINFSNMDTLLRDFNEPGIKLKYSTPSEFIRASNSDNIKWPVNYDDMFPYADHPDAYWTGYFSSRANSKGYIRRGSSNLHLQGLAYTALSLKNAYAGSSQEVSFNSIQDSMGVLQHHDSAPGTEKQAVADNYNALLARSLNMARDNLFNALQGSLIEAEPNLDDMFECGRMNATYTSCPYAEADSYYVAFVNPSFNDQSRPSIKTKGVP